MPTDATIPTIAAIGSAPGASARAMIRLSGPRAIDRVGALCDQRDHRVQAPLSRGVHRVRLRLSETHGLPALVLCAPGPSSYTGEHTAEILLPGNPVLARRVLDLLLMDDDLRLAQPGEFSARAYMNHRLSLAQAEGIALRIAAEHDEALAAASELISGEHGARCDAWAQELATLLALVEAGVDFSDQEDVVPIAPSDLAERLKRLRDAMTDQLGGRQGAMVDADLPRVVLAGAPNAGKSALFNALLGRERASVSSQAGTTRDAIREPLDLSRDAPGAGAVELIDLAGLADAAVDAIDARAQRLAAQILTSADLVLWCDPGGEFDEGQLPLLSSAAVLRVRTKSDLPASCQCPEAIAVCAIDGSALGALRRAIADAATHRQARGGVGGYIPRHRRALASTVAGLDESLTHVDSSARALAHPELVALSMRHALDALGELVGEISPDDVIGRVFASFCVGK